ncbi:hypothetical protein PAXINDRAFT_173533 [Paxillus involutus ATCC 200175]|nr:hypothetical protein PAXINDRAFT_173533 [Paxillus involutus ATCC 200175]
MADTLKDKHEGAARLSAPPCFLVHFDSADSSGNYMSILPTVNPLDRPTTKLVND